MRRTRGRWCSGVADGWGCLFGAWKFGAGRFRVLMVRLQTNDDENIEWATTVDGCRPTTADAGVLEFRAQWALTLRPINDGSFGYRGCIGISVEQSHEIRRVA